MQRPGKPDEILLPLVELKIFLVVFQLDIPPLGGGEFWFRLKLFKRRATGEERKRKCEEKF